MGQATDGQLPADTLGYRAEGVYVPGVGTVAQQGVNVGTDVPGTVYAATVAQTVAGSVTSLSGNSGLPLNVPAVVQKAVAKSTGNVASVAPAFTNGNVAGNSIIVVCAAGNNGTLSVADSNNNTYTSAASVANSTTFETQIFYAVNVAAGANTVTVTNAGAAASMAAEVYEVSGLLQQVTGQPGQTSSGTGTGTAVSTSTISPGTPNQLAFMGVAVGTAAQTITAGTNWTNDSGQQNPTTPSGLFSFASLSQFVPNVGNIAVSATLAGSEPWAAAVATFRPVVLGVEGTVRIAGYNKTNITTGTTTPIKTGAGVLHSITVNKLVASATIELDDALTQTSPFGIITLPGTITALAPFTVIYDVAFTTGLSITTSGATDITVSWK